MTSSTITSSHSESPIRYGTHKYIEYHPGGRDSKLILCAPHGGRVHPDTIQCRDEKIKTTTFEGVGKISTVLDIHTKEIGLLLRDEIRRVSSPEQTPHLIICNLKRCKIDANREVREACLDEPDAIIAYNEFHDFISEAKKLVQNGLFIDLHGQSHAEGWVELGYLLSKKDLLKGNLDAQKTSIRNLATTSTFKMADLISGVASLGTFLEEEGIETIPSPRHPSTSGNLFTGGYNVRRHGSLATGEIDGIQIEIHRKYRNKEEAPKFVTALCVAMEKYMELHYGGF